VSNFDSATLSVLRGRGDGTFIFGSFITTGPNPGSLATGDFNRDGILDIAVVCGEGKLNLLLGNGTGGHPDGTFQPARVLTSGESMYRIALVDIDQDGKLDVLAPGLPGVTIFLGDGAGSLNGSISFPSGSPSVDLLLADLDADHIPDLVTANVYENSISVLLGRCQPKPEIFNFFPAGGRVGDRVTVQ